MLISSPKCHDDFFWPKCHDDFFSDWWANAEKWPKEKALVECTKAFSFGPKSHDGRKKKKRCFRLVSVLAKAFSQTSKCHDDFFEVKMSRWLFSNVTMTFFKCHDCFFKEKLLQNVTMSFHNVTIKMSRKNEVYNKKDTMNQNKRISVQKAHFLFKKTYFLDSTLFYFFTMTFNWDLHFLKADLLPSPEFWDSIRSSWFGTRPEFSRYSLVEGLPSTSSSMSFGGLCDSQTMLWAPLVWLRSACYS